MNLEGDNSDFDTEQFILEVESRPALWDLSDDVYSKKDSKKRNWEELVTIFLKKEDASISERNEFSRILQRRWKSLRDCYSRECQRLEKLKKGSAVSRKTQYVFYNHLSFLRRVIRSKGTANDTEEAVVTDGRTSDWEQLPAVSSASVQSVGEGRGKRRKVDDISPDVQYLVNTLQTALHSREKVEEEEDDDRMFLLSLLKPMKMIPEHLRFGVRMQIMQVIYNGQLNEDKCQVKVEEEF